MQRTGDSRLRAPGITLLLAVLFFVSGCGTLDANVHLEYRDDGDVRSTLTMRTTGAMGTFILGPDFKGKMAAEGWKVTTNVTNDATTLIATITKKRNEQISLPSTGSGSSTVIGQGSAFNESSGLFEKTYEMKLAFPSVAPTPTSQTGGQQLFDPKQMEQLAASMFKVSLSATLPGDIVETNADNSEGNKATWYLGLGQQPEHSLYLKTRQTLWTNVTAIGAGLVALLGIGFVALRRRQRYRIIE